MTDAEIAELLEALNEIFPKAELKNKKRILKELQFLLGYKEPTLSAIYEALRDYKGLHGDVTPLWAACMKEN